MGSKNKIVNSLLFFGALYLLVFLSLNLIEFWHWLKTEISLLKQVETLPNTVQEKEGILFTEREDSIEIPKIEIEAPLVLIKDPENEDFKEALNKGVVLHPQSVLPGQKGEIFILGHSAPLGWPKIHYDWVFSKLNTLEPGDYIYINFQKRRYSYNVTQKIFLERSEEIPENPGSQESILYLISCWPPGRDIRRIAVQAILYP